MRDILWNRPLPLVQTRGSSNRVSWPCVRPFGESRTLALVGGCPRPSTLRSCRVPTHRRSRGWRPWAVGSAEWTFPKRGRDEVGVLRWRTDKIVQIKYRKVQFSLWKCLVFVRKCCIYVGIFLRVELRHKKYVKPPHRSPSPSRSRSSPQSAIGPVRFDFGESEAVGCVQLVLGFCSDPWCFPTVKKPNGR